ncbi:MAB_1171c family putative transporter [Streptomyces atriruber]|uniref:MAB_1171c family putative transporter n=1 Tax=Streptomyces atriruber TaxID=545121 RepID=UPI0006E3183F|nr:MAB_1171c family putative transporter [Streptomyces atriruber]
MNELSDFGRSLTYPSIVTLWFAILVRLPGAIRSPRQRGLWLAVATAATAMTLNSPVGVRLTTAACGPDLHISLARNMFGVLSAGAVLYFVVSTTGSRRLRRTLCVAVAVTMTVLPVLDATSASHGEHGIPPAFGDPIFSLPYWLILMTTHLAANVACVYVCWRYGARAHTRSLRVSLHLFGLGTALVGVYWLALLLRLASGTRWPMSVMPLVMNLHGFLRAAAILVSSVLVVGRTLADAVTTWRLWPLWHDLVDAAPHVALAKNRSRLLDVLWPSVPHRLLLYRKMIETCDAILVLSDYVAAEMLNRARRQVAASRIPAAKSDAAVLAYVMREARRAKLAGLPRRQPTDGVVRFDNVDLEGEKAFLLETARAYASAPVPRAFKRGPLSVRCRTRRTGAKGYY